MPTVVATETSAQAASAALMTTSPHRLRGGARDSDSARVAKLLARGGLERGLRLLQLLVGQRDE